MRRALQEHASSEHSMLRQKLHEAEMMVMACNSAEDAEMATRAIRECRHYWMRLMDMPNQSPRDREHVMECDRHMDALERQLSKALEAYQKKVKR